MVAAINLAQYDKKIYDRARLETRTAQLFRREMSCYDSSATILGLSYEVNTPGSGCQRERLHLFHAFMTVSPLQSTHLKARLYRRYVVFF